MWDDPNNIVPANALSLSEAFEQAFDVMRPDAAKLRAEIGRIFEGDRPEHDEIWFNLDKARSEVLKEFRRALASAPGRFEKVSRKINGSQAQAN
jgi:hypothetical protein